MSRRWYGEKWMMPDEDNEGHPLTKSQVLDLRDRYSEMSTAKLVRLWGKMRLGDPEGSIIQDIFEERGLNIDGTPKTEISFFDRLHDKLVN